MPQRLTQRHGRRNGHVERAQSGADGDAQAGVGRLVVTGINQRNYPTVQVGVLAIATIFIFVSLVTDLIVAWLDPRVADGEAT